MVAGIKANRHSVVKRICRIRFLLRLINNTQEVGKVIMKLLLGYSVNGLMVLLLLTPFGE